MFWLILFVLVVLWAVPVKILAYAFGAILAVLIVTCCYLVFALALTWLLQKIDRCIDRFFH